MEANPSGRVKFQLKVTRARTVEGDGLRTRHASEPRTTPCGSVSPVDRIQPRRQRRADQQVIMPAAGRDAPAQQLARSRQDLVGASRELVAVDAGDVGAIIGVLLEAAAVDEPDEGPAEI